MASKRVNEFGVELAKLMMEHFPEIEKSHDVDVTDALIAIGALAGGVLAGAYFRRGQFGVDEGFLLLQRSVQTNMTGTIRETRDLVKSMRGPSEKGMKGVN